MYGSITRMTDGAKKQTFQVLYLVVIGLLPVYGVVPPCTW